jgi:hypothetical protein
MAFFVGQKVLCIKSKRWRSMHNGRFMSSAERGPKYLEVVTIREFDDSFLRFVEYRNSPIRGGVECSFDPRHFRPVVERKTDISIFTKMLTPNSRELCGNE